MKTNDETNKQREEYSAAYLGEFMGTVLERIKALTKTVDNIEKKLDNVYSTKTELKSACEELEAKIKPLRWAIYTAGGGIIISLVGAVLKLIMK